MPKLNVVTIVSYLLALAFLLAGAMKIARVDFELEAFATFGLPVWLMVYVGIAEIAAAVLLIRAKTATLGAIVGVAVMLVAIPAHLFSNEVMKAPVPLAFLAAFLFVGWAQRKHLARLLG